MPKGEFLKHSPVILRNFPLRTCCSCAWAVIDARTLLTATFAAPRTASKDMLRFSIASIPIASTAFVSPVQKTQSDFPNRMDCNSFLFAVVNTSHEDRIEILERTRDLAGSGLNTANLACVDFVLKIDTSTPFRGFEISCFTHDCARNCDAERSFELGPHSEFMGFDDDVSIQQQQCRLLHLLRCPLPRHRVARRDQ